MDDQLTLILIIVGAAWGAFMCILISCLCWRANEKRREHQQREEWERKQAERRQGPYAAVRMAEQGSHGMR